MATPSAASLMPILQALSALGPKVSQLGQVNPSGQYQNANIQAQQQPGLAQAFLNNQGSIPQTPGSGPVANATAAYANTQSQRMPNQGALGVGEAIFDAIQEPKKRKLLIEAQQDLAIKQQEKDEAIRKKQAQAVMTIALQQNGGNREEALALGDMAYQNPTFGEDYLKQMLKPQAAGQMSKQDERAARRSDIIANPDRYSSFSPRELQDFEADGTVPSIPGKSNLHYNIPAGYSADDPNNPAAGIHPTPGGEPEYERGKYAAEKEEERQQTKMGMLEQAYNAENVISTVDEALDKVGWLTTGFFGDKIKDIAGTDAANLAGLTSTIKANVAFKALFDMRQASKTGGALGNVSNQEIKLLHDSWAALDSTLSPTQQRTNLIKIRDKYERAIYAIENDAILREMPTDKARKMIKTAMKQSKSDRLLQKVPPQAVELLRNSQDQKAAMKEFEKEYGFTPLLDTYE